MFHLLLEMNQHNKPSRNPNGYGFPPFFIGQTAIWTTFAPCPTLEQPQVHHSRSGGAGGAGPHGVSGEVPADAALRRLGRGTETVLNICKHSHGDTPK